MKKKKKKKKKTPLAKFAEALQIPWPKALLLVLLPARYSLLELKPSHFEIVTGYSLLLAPASFDPQLITEKILQNC